MKLIKYVSVKYMTTITQRTEGMDVSIVLYVSYVTEEEEWYYEKVDCEELKIDTANPRATP